MKALILAAGYGTRLAPYTDQVPKPLFTITGRPVMDFAIQQLLDAGCTKIFINTHHLASQIEQFVDAHPSKKFLETVYEPEILETGGAMANLAKKLNQDDFLVINADVLCDFDLSGLMSCHKASGAVATLLVHDCPRFNKLCVEKTGTETAWVRHFTEPPETGLAFTGIQAVSPDIFGHMPSKKVFSSIDVYQKLSSQKKVLALMANQLYWRDMGTPEDYQDTARVWLAAALFHLPPSRFHEIKISLIAGDGSDRSWYRACHGNDSLILSDHGICIEPCGNNNPPAQLNAFVKIGAHLARQGVAVPEIYGHDTISGQVAVQDLGPVRLAEHIKDLGEKDTIYWYDKVIDGLIDFSFNGIMDFNPAWTCQTPTYSEQVIMDLECRYFMEAFVNTYLGCKAQFENFRQAFSHIAENALAHGITGLMHRDCQSKNIMIHNDAIWFIDFQSARLGPIQYDLASLFIDPYVTLPRTVQDRLLEMAIDKIGAKTSFDRLNFTRTYQYCCLSRNLQILGAFGFLTRIKKKPGFQQFIPPALTGLDMRLTEIGDPELSDLTRLVRDLLGEFS